MGGAISPRRGGRRGQFAGWEAVTGGSKKRRGEPDWQRTCRIATETGQLQRPDGRPDCRPGFERAGLRGQARGLRVLAVGVLAAASMSRLAADSPAEPAALRPAPSPRTSLSIRLKDGLPSRRIGRGGTTRDQPSGGRIGPGGGDGSKRAPTVTGRAQATDLSGRVAQAPRQSIRIRDFNRRACLSPRDPSRSPALG